MEVQPLNEPGQTTIAEAGSADAFRVRLDGELRGNILPFWIAHAVDDENGGFYGALTNDLRVLNEVPRSSVLCARILWTYAAAYRAFGDDAYLAMARRAYEYLARVFWDPAHSGLYWMVDKDGLAVSDRKQTYAQAFAIYGLSEYYRATQDAGSLRVARELFELLEVHAHEAIYGGYLEGCTRDWGELADTRLDEKDPECCKSMNTLLHVMEAYASLLRVWDDQRLRVRLRELLEILFQHVIDPQTHHLRLFFDDAWGSLYDFVSYGHDIEASWLLVEAAEVLGDPDLLARARAVSVEMAWAVYTQGLDADGSLLYEADARGLTCVDKHWWPQAEGVVGFYNAYQICGDERLAQASLGCWKYTEENFVDREHGEWFKVLNRQGVPYLDHYKIGPWECPYHHSRTCLEMLRRLV
jgi:cellobiose epimerase